MRGANPRSPRVGAPPTRRALLALGLVLLGVVAAWLALPRMSPRKDAAGSAAARAARPSMELGATHLLASPPNDEASGGPAALGVAAELDAIHQGFLRKLHELPPWIEYEACRQKGGQGCEASWTAAVTLALTLAIHTTENQELGNALLDDRASGALRDAVAERMKSSDPLQRITTLGLLGLNSRTLVEVDLPSEAYTDLSQRSMVENQLLLTRHVVKTLPSDAVATQVRAMALNSETDLRVLPIAVRALGHPRNAELLLDVTRHWLSPDGQAMLDPVALLAALQRCGPACTPGIEAMAKDARPTVRDHAASILASAAAP
jgi:hypothetical protein